MDCKWLICLVKAHENKAAYHDSCSYHIVLIIATSSMSTQDQSLNHGTRHDPSTVARNVNMDSLWTERIKQSCMRLARAKTKYQLLSDHPEQDIFTSVRPKIGKKFSLDILEDKKRQFLSDS